MANKTSRPPRTLSNLKSAVRRKGASEGGRYVNFFQIGALELERQRRQSERVTALQKLADVDCRLTEIAAEIEGLLRDAEVDLAPRQSLAGESSPSKQGFNLKY